jgi:hypothetical protein
VLGETQEKVAKQREQLKAQRLEIESLRTQSARNKHGRVDSSESENDSDENIAKKVKSSKDDTGALQTDALQAGKRFAVCNMLWIPPGAIQYLPLIAHPSGDDEEPESEDEQTVEAAQAIYNSLANPLRRYVGIKWFRTRVSF